MSQRTLYLRLGSDDGITEWLLTAADGNRRLGRSALAELSAELQGARLVVLVPATDVTLARVVLPPVKRAQQRQAALFALEDQLVDDIADLHAALGERLSDGTLSLAVVGRARIEGWLESLAQHHLRPEQMLVDLLLLPLADGEWSVLWEDDGVRIRTSRVGGISFDPAQWSLIWSHLLRESGEQLPHTLRVFDARTITTEPLPLDGALPEGAVVVVPNAASLQWLVAGDGPAGPLNLLQGDYSRREQWGRILRPWRPAAALFLLWLVIQGGMAFFDLHRLRQQEQQLDAQMVELYRKISPEARKVEDPLKQMKDKLAAFKSGDSGFMKLAATAAPALRNTMVKGMRYQDRALDIDITLPDMAALDTLRSALTAKGLLVEIGNAAQQDGKVESRLTVRGGGA